MARPVLGHPFASIDRARAWTGPFYGLSQLFCAVGREATGKPTITATTVECFDRGQRVASHVRSGLKGRHTTAEEHMLAKHRKMGQWSPERFIRFHLRPQERGRRREGKH